MGGKRDGSSVLALGWRRAAGRSGEGLTDKRVVDRKGGSRCQADWLVGLTNAHAYESREPGDDGDDGGAQEDIVVEERICSGRSGVGWVSRRARGGPPRRSNRRCTYRSSDLCLFRTP